MSSFASVLWVSLLPSSSGIFNCKAPYTKVFVSPWTASCDSISGIGNNNDNLCSAVPVALPEVKLTVENEKA